MVGFAARDCAWWPPGQLCESRLRLHGRIAMHALHAKQANAVEPLRSLGCWLLALAVFVQSLWLPFHLASERHLAPGEWPAQCAALAASSSRCAELRDDGDGGPLRRLHLGLEHKSAKDTRVDDDAVAPPDLDEPCLPNAFLLVLDAPAVRAFALPQSLPLSRAFHAPHAARAPPIA